MNQTRQFIGYLIIFLAASMMWQSWQQQEESQEKANKSLPESASSHVGSVAGTTSIEVSPKDRIIEVSTGLTNINIDLQGGRIVAADLLEYKEQKNGLKPVSFIGQDKKSYLTSQFGMTGDTKVLFKSNYKKYSLSPNQEELKVVLTGTNSTGVDFVKTFTFYKGKYHFMVEGSVKNSTDHAYNGHPYSQFRQFVMDDPSTGKSLYQRFVSATRFNTFTGVSYYSTQDSYVKLSYKDMDEKQIDKNFVGGWVAVQKPYFLGAWVPQNNRAHHLYTDQKLYSEGKVYTAGMLGKQVVVAPGEEFSSSSVFYSGPEVTSILKGVAKGLDLTIDYGWLWMLSNSLFWLLDNIHKVVQNWGLAIILVTCAIKGAFYKMSESSYISISKMKKIQPRLEALKKLHGDDREKLGVATRELFLQEKVNPLGGCLPVVIQIPFFIALYYVLIESVQLRHAPFALWIQDLSAPDPYFVLPILMGLSMLYQQSLNPKPEDPIQEKMMYFFPVFLTVLFSSFPAGLVLYWVTNNLLSIWQQTHVAKRFGPKSS